MAIGRGGGGGGALQPAPLLYLATSRRLWEHKALYTPFRLQEDEGDRQPCFLNGHRGREMVGELFTESWPARVSIYFPLTVQGWVFSGFLGWRGLR